MFREHVLDDSDAVTFGHAQIEHHDVRLMPFVEGDGFVTVAGLGDHLHVRLLIDHGREAVAHDRVIVRQNEPDLSVLTKSRRRFAWEGER